MLTKILLRIWPALIPWLIYFLWILVFKKFFLRLKKRNFDKNQNFKIIEMEAQQCEEAQQSESTEDSSQRNSQQKNFWSSQNKDSQSLNFYPKKSLLENRHFVVLMYMSLILAIISVISFAF